MDIGLTDCPVDVCKTALTLPGDEQSTESVEERVSRSKSGQSKTAEQSHGLVPHSDESKWG